MSNIEKEQAAKKVAKKEKIQEPVVYIGPDIPDAKQYTVFNNGLPESLKKRITEKPFFNALFVPVMELAQAQKELAKAGSALNVLYKKARKEQ